MARRVTYNKITGCDERRVQKTGEVFSQYRFSLPVPDPQGLSVRSITHGDDDEFAKKVAASPAGMASWAGTGPLGETCEHCQFFAASDYLRGECKRYVELRKAQGEGKPVPIAFSARTPACRHFKPDPNARTPD